MEQWGQEFDKWCALPPLMQHTKNLKNGKFRVTTVVFPGGDIVSYNSGVSVSALTTNALNTRLVPAQVTKTLTPKYNDRLSCSSYRLVGLVVKASA